MNSLLHWLEQHEHTRLALSLLALLAVLAYLLQSPELSQSLRYERSGFAAHPWQGFTHAVVHLNLRHLSLNVLALLCLVALFSEAFRSAGWWLALLASAFVSAMGLYFFSPLTAWCAGLSGALHGLMVYAVLRSRAHWIWLLALVAKVGIEQTGFYQHSAFLHTTAEYIGEPVVVDAHLWGAIGGLLFFLAVHAIAYVRVAIEINRARP